MLGGFSDVNDGEELWGGDVFGYFSPTYKFDDSLFLIPLYTVEYKRSIQFINQDEGIQLNSEYMTHNANLALRKEYEKDWFIKGSAFGTWNYVKETKDESWTKGLYDYRDVGCSFDLSHKNKSSYYKDNYSIGFEYYRRMYPNFVSLASIGMPSAPEKNEKDFDAFKLGVGLNRITSTGTQLYLKPYYLFKRFIDKHTVNDDGTYELSQMRKDQIINLDYGFRLPLNEEFSVGMDNNYLYNFSNLGYYDSMSTLLPNDDVFTHKYYSYHSASALPYVEYIHSLEEEKDVRLKLLYSYLFRYYPERKAQGPMGDYTSQDEQDFEHILSSSFAWPLTKNLDFLIRYSYTWARSNQKYEQFYRYKYDTYEIQTGISLDF